MDMNRGIVFALLANRIGISNKDVFYYKVIDVVEYYNLGVDLLRTSGDYSWCDELVNWSQLFR